MAEVARSKVAVLATDGVEQVELTEPVRALRLNHAEVTVIAPRSGQIQGMNHHDKGDLQDFCREMVRLFEQRARRRAA